MKEILQDVRSGRFAEQLTAEAESGYPLLENARNESRARSVERVFNELQKLSREP